MQFSRVNPRNDLALDVTIKPPVKSNARTRPQHPPKSSPPDPEDLRRRLYIVLSEQNAQREARRQMRAQKASDGAVDSPLSATSFAARAAATTAGTTAPGLRLVIAPPRADASRDIHGSSHNKGHSLRRANSKLDAGAKDVKRSKSFSTRAKKPATAESAAQEEHPYHHVPQVAAQQFARTATAKASLCDMSNVHPLSRQALKFHMEGSAAERAELQSSKTPREQLRALRRAQSTRERLQERNQFQDDAPHLPAGPPIPTGTSAALSPPTASPCCRRRRRRRTMGSPLNTNSNSKNSGDYHYQYQSGDFSPTARQSNSHRRQRPRSFADLVPSAEPLVVRTHATGADRRVDWAQEDEKDRKISSQQQRSNSNGSSKVPRSPLLRKADSLWALKGKLVSVTTGRHSPKQHSDSSNNKSRNSANSSETGMSSSPVKSPSRGGFFARLRRFS
ncbi:hypothetical protein PG994_001260 [Apiospora phragmitis]|uniref:Uncharacterized protein n=1 Tax=Apiospora phragmitis TaxID=2905665 RepID=A0ABR1WT10_9PEZI